MINKKVIVCDLDGTLAMSKSDLSLEMAKVLCGVLSKHFLAVISGGSFEQFQKQFLSHLACSPELLQNLYIFPTMGGACYVYNVESNDWKQIYGEKLSEDDRDLIINAMKEMVGESGMDFGQIYGEQVDDRGTQVTFSAKGQNAPLEAKDGWDTDQSKRRVLVDILQKKIPQFEIRMGGATSIDVTKKGMDKAFAVERLQDLLKVPDEDIIFIGDALYSGGNDAPVKKTGVDYIQTNGPQEAVGVLSRYL